jgi:integrase
MAFVPREKYKKKHPTEVLTLAEVFRVLDEARKEKPGVLSWVIWLMFTGMRPEAEAIPFWAVPDPDQPGQLPEQGWSKIDLERWQIMVTDDLEKTGAVNRDVTIQPCLREWIQYLQKHRPTYSRRALRRIFEKAIPQKRTQDILRHTCISFALKIMKESDLCYEAATSSKMIKKHYRRQIPQSEADKFWAITPAILGLPP